MPEVSLHTTCHEGLSCARLSYCTCKTSEDEQGAVSSSTGRRAASAGVGSSTDALAGRVRDNNQLL